MGFEMFEGFIKLRADGSSVNDDIRNITKAAGALLAGAFVMKVAVDGLDELKEQQDVAAKTQATLKATGEAAQVSQEHVDSLAESMQALTGKDKEAVQAGENMLLQFRNVRNEVGDGNDIFDQATKAALDFSVATGTDLTSAFRTLGRALNDPVQGARALRAANITLTESEKEQIKTFVESGRTIEAQKFILERLEKQVGGVAEAYGDTLAGKMERTNNVLDDAKASLVAGLAPALEVGASAATALAHGVEALPGPLQTVVGLVGAGAVGYRLLNPLLGSSVGLFTASGEAAAGAAVGAGAFTAALAPLTIAATALLFAYGQLNDMLNETKKTQDEVIGGINQSIDSKGFDNARDSISRYNEQIAKLKKDNQDLHDSLNPVDAAKYIATTGAVDAQVAALETSKKRTEELIERTRELVRTKGMSEEAAYNQAVAEKNNTEATKDGADATKVSAEADDQATDSSKWLTEQRKQEEDSTKRVTTALDQYYDGLTKTGQVRVSMERAILDTNKAIADQTAILNDGKKSQDEKKRAVLDLADAFQRQAKAAVDQAEDQAKANGKTLDGAEKAKIYKAELEKLEGKVPGLRGQLVGLLGDINNIPDRKTTQLVLDIIAKGWDQLRFDGTGGPISAEDAQRVTDAAQSVYQKLGDRTGHQGGGHVNAGEGGRVGEGGEEYFVPDVPGSIVPNYGKANDTGGGALADTINITINGPTNERTMHDLRHELTRYSFLIGAGRRRTR